MYGLAVKILVEKVGRKEKSVGCWEKSGMLGKKCGAQGQKGVGR